MNTKNGSSNLRKTDPRLLNRAKLPYPLRKNSWIVLVFAVCSFWGLLISCNLLNNLLNPALDGTATANASTAQAAHEQQVNLAVIATQTAQALLPSSTPFPPTESPTGSPTSSPIPPTPSPSSTPTSTPETPTATNTPLTPTPHPPTQTPYATWHQLNFRKGGTSIYIQKPINASLQHIYTVWAKKGQTMILSVSSPNQDVTLDVRGLQGGQQLIWSGSQTTYWVGTLPASQDYAITITTHNPDTYYFLSVEVPANIYFETGAYSATVEGYVDVDTAFHPGVMTRVRYLAWASAGQTMKVKLKSPNLDALSFGIIGQQDGQAYISYQVKNNGGEFTLPISQGYYLDVYAINGQSTAFTLKITIK
jgi:hypothetical protein